MEEKLHADPGSKADKRMLRMLMAACGDLAGKDSAGYEQWKAAEGK